MGGRSEFLRKLNKQEGVKINSGLEFLGRKGATVSKLSTKDHPNWE